MKEVTFFNFNRSIFYVIIFYLNVIFLQYLFSIVINIFFEVLVMHLSMSSPNGGSAGIPRGY